MADHFEVTDAPIGKAHRVEVEVDDATGVFPLARLQRHALVRDAGR
jgi:hypothetical protein